MTDFRNTVKVEILSDEYAIRSAASPEETRKVAAYVDAAIRDVMKSGMVVETHKAAILACLRIAAELFEARARADALTDTMAALSDEIRPWLPPAKRHD
jgi:cell division protein ZapA (FtsZ GTPase activity inhibitor)